MAHLKRWLTAGVAIPILIYIIGFGPRRLLHGLLFVVSCICLHEFFRLTSSKLPVLPRAIAFVLCFSFVAFFSEGLLLPVFAVLCLAVIICLSFYLFSDPDLKKQVIQDTGTAALGVLYIGLPLSLLVLMDRVPRGNVWIFFLLTVIFLGDTMALYCGRLFGKHKLYVSVSPGKTWEGAVGGFVASVLGGIFFSQALGLHESVGTIAVLSGVLSIAGQAGDLAESMIKRNCGVKDSGAILPGHGGFLDRVDALLFAIPVLYVFVIW